MMYHPTDAESRIKDLRERLELRTMMFNISSRVPNIPNPNLRSVILAAASQLGEDDYPYYDDVDWGKPGDTPVIPEKDRPIRKSGPEEWKAELESWTPEQRELEYQQLRAKLMPVYEEACRITAEVRTKWEAIKAELRQWTPPTRQHNVVLDAAEKMVRESLENLRPPLKPEAVEYETSEAWFRTVMFHVNHDLDYIQKRKPITEKEAIEAREWLQKLVDSLPA